MGGLNLHPRRGVKVYIAVTLRGLTLNLETNFVGGGGRKAELSQRAVPPPRLATP